LSSLAFGATRTEQLPDKMLDRGFVTDRFDGIVVSNPNRFCGSLIHQHEPRDRYHPVRTIFKDFGAKNVPMEMNDVRTIDRPKKISLNQT